MNRTPRKNKFWHLFGPFLLYWGIEWAAAVIAALVMLALSMPEMMQSVAWKDAMTNEEIASAAMQMQTAMLETAAHYQVQMLAAAALCTIPVMAMLFQKDRKLEQVLHVPVNKKAPLQKYVWTVILGIVVCIGGNVLIVMTNLAFVSEGYKNVSSVFYTPSFPVQMICLGIIIPISEELIFRGILFKRCRELMGFLPAAAGISFLFGFTHGNLVQLFYAVGLGMLLAYAYEKYGSLKAAVLLHITANITSLILTETGVLTWMCSAFIRLAVSVVACAFFGAAAFVMIQRIDEKPEGVEDPKKNGMY